MSLIINPRGGSGAGKSTLMRQVIDHFGVKHELAFQLDNRILNHAGYVLNNGLQVLGNYDNPCGGCDALGGTFKQIEDLVRSLAKQGDVLYEGLLYATVFRSSDTFAREMEAAGHHVVFGLLNTPLELCHRRVLARRQAAGNDKPFPVEKLLTKYRSCWSSQERLRQAGHDTRPIPHERGLETVLGWLSERQGAKWTTTAPASSRS